MQCLENLNLKINIFRHYDQWNPPPKGEKKIPTLPPIPEKSEARTTFTEPIFSFCSFSSGAQVTTTSSSGFGGTKTFSDNQQCNKP
jgi:hypothetical protein